MLEFGARSRNVTCDIASLIEGVHFPTARPRVKLPSELFLGKSNSDSRLLFAEATSRRPLRTSLA
jgi:hypothetical protein